MEQEKLILDNINLIYLCIKRMGIYKYLDDYFDIGIVGLVKGARSYDKTKNIKPSTYLYRCIYNEFALYFRKHYEDKNKEISLNKKIYSNSEGELTLEDTLESRTNIEEDLIHKETIKELYNALSKLSLEEQKIIIYTYELFNCDKLNQNQLSNVIGKSQAQISRIKNNAIDKLKKEMIK